MLSERANETLRPLVMTLRIIVIALALGVLSFALFAVFQNAARPLNIGANINYLFLGLAAPTFLAGFIVPRLLPKGGAFQPSTAAIKGSDETAVVQAVFTPIQTATIVGCALFEGAAFANLIAYLMNAELVHLAIGGLALFCILAHFPLMGRLEQQIEEQLHAQRDEQQFKT